MIYTLRMIFKMMKLLSVHIVRHQSSGAQLVFKTTTSNTKEVSNAQRTSKRGRGRRTHKREEGKPQCKSSSLHIHRKHVHLHHYLWTKRLWYIVGTITCRVFENFHWSMHSFVKSSPIFSRPWPVDTMASPLIAIFFSVIKSEDEAAGIAMQNRHSV